MDHRTYGATRNCKGCKYWSEMIAKCEGGGSVQALCLASASPNASKYTVASTTCDAFEPGYDGAIDQPGGYHEPSEFACGWCGREFDSLRGLKTHVGRVHKEERAATQDEEPAF